MKSKFEKIRSRVFACFEVEFLSINKNLVAAWLVAVGAFAAIFYYGPMNQQFLPGMTEAREHIVNFKESVIVETILVQSGQFIDKGDLLFILSRPDIELQESENAANLRQAVVELNIMNNVDRPAKVWDKRLRTSKKKGETLNPLEMRFLSLFEMQNYLEAEKTRLKVLSPVTGHAGEVNFNVGETVAPYTSLVSLYHAKPSIVKSYIPESFSLAELSQNRSTVIRSQSRNFMGKGAIISVGSLLTELPARFQKDPMNKLFGREVKIALPPENGFYLGEKVIVSLEEK